uniref:Zn(2)-C6 fungal-type domain-containing protein n=2 Tax=Bionectria ochroleuca TaxID=29856 RepID=A0A0B7KLZ6_BIOOC
MELQGRAQAVRCEPVAASSSNPPSRSKTTDASQSEGSSVDAAEVSTNKRHVVDGSTARYPRKRGATACHLCRVRKTKCDNARPGCGSCVQHKAKCVYGSSSEAKIPFDAASEEILSRLSAIQSLLSHAGNPVSPITVGGATTCYDQTWPAPNVHQGFTLQASWTPGLVSDDTLRTQGYSATVLSATRCETLLHWPVFEDVLSARDSKTESFLLDWISDQDELPNLEASGNQQSSTSEAPNAPEKRQRQVHAADYVSLCHTFLSTIHRRNPILNGDVLIESARHVMKHGLGWDTRACLVLLASALAHCGLSRSFEGRARSDQVESTSEGIEKSLIAEAFYTEARKRIGFLGSSITDIQCLFLASMYEKLTLNIIKAWEYTKDACSRLQTYLARCRRMPYKQRPDHLEPRIFWSCMKAESDLVAELPLQSSGIENFEYPYMFPTPPRSAAKGTDTRSPYSGLVASKGSQNQRIVSEEESWFFYTADISFRRILNQHLKVLYTEAEAGWMEDINLAFAQFTECEKQVEVWYRHLPPVIQSGFEGQPDNELSLFLKGRFQGWRELIRRPFLYYALHHSSGEPTDPRVIALATESLHICASLIHHFFPQSRHGGTWFIARRTFTCSLLMLAAVFANRKDVQPPDDWPATLQVAINFLERWETEACDIARMRAILCKIVDEACRKSRTRAAG